MTSKERKQFLKTKEWKEHRLKIAEKDENIDFITQSKLRRGYNCHHLNLNKEEYDDLSNLDNFISLNKTSHEVLHFLFGYYKKDPFILDRIKQLLDKMNEVNS